MYPDPKVPRHEKSLYKPYISLYSGCLWVIYYPQESLYKPYKYHGYTVRGTPNCPLSERYDYRPSLNLQKVFAWMSIGMYFPMTDPWDERYIHLHENP